MNASAGFSLTPRELTFVLWCMAVIEVIMEGPRAGEMAPFSVGSPTESLREIKSIRQKLLGPPEVVNVERIDT